MSRESLWIPDSCFQSPLRKNSLLPARILTKLGIDQQVGFRNRIIVLLVIKLIQFLTQQMVLQESPARSWEVISGNQAKISLTTFP